MLHFFYFSVHTFEFSVLVHIWERMRFFSIAITYGEECDCALFRKLHFFVNGIFINFNQQCACNDYLKDICRCMYSKNGKKSLHVKDGKMLLQLHFFFIFRTPHPAYTITSKIKINIFLKISSRHITVSLGPRPIDVQPKNVPPNWFFI